MINKNFKKIVSKDPARPYLQNVFYSKEREEYCATNGYILITQKTTDNFCENMTFDVLTGKATGNAEYFPKYDYIVDDIKIYEEIKAREFEIYVNPAGKVKKVVKIDDDNFFDYKLIKSIIDCIGTDFKLYSCPDSLYFANDTYKAVVMKVGIDVNNYQQTAQKLDTFKKTKQKAVKFVYIVQNESGEIIGVFSNESEAMKRGESKSYVIL